MSKLKKKLERIAAGETHNHQLVQAYLQDLNAPNAGRVLSNLTQRQGRAAKHPPSTFLPMLD